MFEEEFNCERLIETLLFVEKIEKVAENAENDFCFDISDLRLLKFLNISFNTFSNGKKTNSNWQKYIQNVNCQHIFVSTSIEWNLNNIQEFVSILDEKSPYGGYNWWGLSKKLNSKDVIVTYSKSLNLFNLVFDNPEIIWDSQLTKILIDSNLSLNINRFSQGLPDLFQQIIITNFDHL